MVQSRSGDMRLDLPVAVLVTAFIASVVAANVTGGKIVSIVGFSLSVGALAYPITFLYTDVLSDVFGKRATQQVIWMGFLANVLVGGFIWLSVQISPAEFWLDQGEYANVLGASARVFFASTCAFLTSQLIDVEIFHFIKRLAPGFGVLWIRNNASTFISQGIDTVAHSLVSMSFIALLDTPICFGVLWIRNNASTFISQGIDTVLFASIAFIGVVPFEQVLDIIIGQYVIKLFIALLDTPICYLGVWVLTRRKDYEFDGQLR